jgi:hypothetical protein
MDRPFKRLFLTEFLWLMGLILIAGVVEYVIIVLFDLHPILSVKIQGLIGLTIIAYGIRMVARLMMGIQESPEE